MGEILSYIHGNGVFHRMHPAAKGLIVLALGVMAILSVSVPFLLLLLGAVVSLAFVGGILREILDQLKLILAMGAVFILVTLVTMPGGDTLFSLPGGLLPVTTGALDAGVVLTLRFAILIMSFQIFVATTQPRDLVNALERAGVPVDYTLMFLIALRFIPTLQAEARRIHEAQLARGYSPGKGPVGKVRSIAPVLVPLVSNALGRAHTLGLTIDMRGYRTRARTPVREVRFARPDWITSGIAGVTLAVYILSLACPHGGG
ncbi:MAG: energy-coupling factor transporter transmembrane component T [Methanolinea sp.]